MLDLPDRKSLRAVQPDGMFLPIDCLLLVLLSWAGSKFCCRLRLIKSRNWKLLPTIWQVIWATIATIKWRIYLNHAASITQDTTSLFTCRIVPPCSIMWGRPCLIGHINTVWLVVILMMVRLTAGAYIGNETRLCRHCIRYELVWSASIRESSLSCCEDVFIWRDDELRLI